MTKSDIIIKLEALGLDKSKYWLNAGGALVFYGLREETRDIDLGCDTEITEQLIREGHEVTLTDNGTRKIVINGEIEIFENWLFGGKTETVDGFRVISPEGLLATKRWLNRPKDQKDIENLEKFLAGRK